MALTLQQMRAGSRDPAVAAAIDVLRQRDQLVGALPFENTGATSLYAFKRAVGEPTVTWAARGATTSATDTLKEVEVISRTARVVARQQMDRSDAGDVGGVALMKGRKTVGALKAISKSLGSKIIGGARNYSATISNSALTVSNGLSITNVGPNILNDRGNGSLKYTHSGTTVAFRAPGEVEYGAAVTCGTSTVVKAYSYNQDAWVEVTHGSQALSADDTADVVFTIGASEFDGLFELVAGQTSRVIYGGTNGGNLSFSLLDQLLDLVIADDGEKVLMFSERTMRAYRALMRGVTISPMEIAGRLVPSYSGVPILVTQNMPTTRTRGSASGTCTAAFCATLGRGKGLCGVYSELENEDYPNARVITRAMGVEVLDLGLSGDANMSHLAVGHFGLMSEDIQGLALLDGLLDTSA